MSAVTPSSGCVWFDLKLPCQEAKCAICAMSEPSIFDLLEPLSAALIGCGGPNIRGGFARGTGGVDMPFIINALAGTARAYAALKVIERESVIEGADQGDPHADSIERSQALDALADIRAIARHAIIKARGEQPL